MGDWEESCCICGIRKGFHEFSYCKPEMENRRIPYALGVIEDEQEHLWWNYPKPQYFGKSLADLFNPKTDEPPPRKSTK